jgi:predicted regulator of Ras-like GTPase activity (Roadblock/LC7/MglB family)
VRVPFKDLLKELVASVQGASGAILLEADGEAVQWHADAEVERLRLRAAYIALVLKGCRASTSLAKLGDTGCVILQYDGANFLGQQVERDYFLVLELDASANLGQAIHRIRPAAAIIRRELAA